MKFKDSKNWKLYPTQFGGEEGIDLIGSLLRTNKDYIQKIEINVFKDGDRKKEFNCKIYSFDYYVDAYEFLEDKDLLEIDYINIYWDYGVGVSLLVLEESGVFVRNVFKFEND